LIAGFRRYWAAKLVGMTDIEVKIYEGPLTESQIKVINLTENIHRKDLEASERYEALVEFQKLHPKLPMKDLAELLKLDPPHLCKLLAPSKCIPAWQEAFKAGRVTAADIYAASKATTAQAQHELLRLKLEEGATRDQLERSVRKARPKGTDPVSSSTVTIPLPSGIRVVVRGKRLTLAEVVECLSECVDAAKKGLKEKLSVKSWQAVLHDKAKGVANV
jgi:ParB-like chromosome segregation protein Spo0J